MASKRMRFLGSGLLAGALALGTAGLVAAQDPTPTPAQNPGWVGSVGMMGGQYGPATMMGGQYGAGMMTGAQSQQMATLHDQMAASAACDSSQMQSLHAQRAPSR